MALRRRWWMALLGPLLACSPTEVVRQIQSTLALRHASIESLGLDDLPTEAASQGPRLETMDTSETLPLVGPEGTAADGYPTQHADQVALLNLLRLQRFDALDRWFDAYEDAFARDRRKETWPTLALVAFECPDVALEPLLTAWIEHSPNRAAPWAALASHRYAVAWHKRGHKWSHETSGPRWIAFYLELLVARIELEVALAWQPDYVAGHLLAMDIARSAGRPDDADAAFAVIQARCEDCLLPRQNAMQAAKPRWGGSYRRMRALAREYAALSSSNPRLAALGGYEAVDRCNLLTHAKRWTQAEHACDLALSFGDEPEFLIQRASLHLHRDSPRLAIELLDRALVRVPFLPDALRHRYRARTKLEDWIGAAQDVMVLRQLDPSDADIAEIATWMVDKLRYEGDQHRKAGRQDEAAALFEVGLQLAPDDFDLMSRRGFNRLEGSGVADLQARVETTPDDYRQHLELDHALATQRRFDEVVAMWNGYLARHPDDARAIRERGGAQWHRQKHREAIADMDTACGMGLAAACKDAQGMKARGR